MKKSSSESADQDLMKIESSLESACCDDAAQAHDGLAGREDSLDQGCDATMVMPVDEAATPEDNPLVLQPRISTRAPHGNAKGAGPGTSRRFWEEKTCKVEDLGGQSLLA